MCAARRNHVCGTTDLIMQCRLIIVDLFDMDQYLRATSTQIILVM